jgi:ADP-heptose:LPS heptosyltransferase
LQILAVKTRRLGDTVLWTAALQALRAQYPFAAIDLAFPAAYADLFAAPQPFRRLFPLGGSTAPPEWRRSGYDLALCFHASPGSRRLVRTARAKRCLIHHHSRRPRNFGSHERIVDLGRPTAAIERDLNVVRTLGWRGTSPAPRVVCPETWVDVARRRWPAPADRPRVILGPGASRPAKQWPLERYVALAARLKPLSEVGILVENEGVFRGQPRWRRELARVATLLPSPELRDAMGFLALARGYAGSDSGIKHLAAALGVATVTLFGPESIAEWHGYDGNRHRYLQAAVGCRDNDAGGDPLFAWCGEAICPLGSHACMNLIREPDVAALLEAAIGGTA